MGMIPNGGAPSFTDAVYSDPAETTPESILSTTEEVLRKVYPVGAIYMSINSTDPADLFGFGTWERVKDRFLLAAGDAYAAGSTGGEATHTLTIAEMPRHTHYYYINETSGIPQMDFSIWSWGFTGDKWHQVYEQNNKDFTRLGMAPTGSGNNQPHNNMPPYLAVYIWKRTA